MTRSNIRGICNLCLQDVRLCKSHLLPDGFRKIISEKEEVNFNKIYVPGGTVKKENRMEISKNILCSKCDALLGKYDEHLISFYKDFYFSTERTIRSCAYARNVNFEKISLGYLATLWRMSLSENHPIILGKYSDVFRCWLWEGAIPRDQSAFTIWIPYGTCDDQKPLCRSILYPYGGRVENQGHLYFFMMLGLFVIIKIGTRRTAAPLNKFKPIDTCTEEIRLQLIPFEDSCMIDQLRDLKKQLQPYFERHKE